MKQVVDPPMNGISHPFVNRPIANLSFFIRWVLCALEAQPTYDPYSLEHVFFLNTVLGAYSDLRCSVVFETEQLENTTVYSIHTRVIRTPQNEQRNTDGSTYRKLC